MLLMKEDNGKEKHALFRLAERLLRLQLDWSLETVGG
jgi:hypothetical protein